MEMTLETHSQKPARNLRTRAPISTIENVDRTGRLKRNRSDDQVHTRCGAS